MPSWSGMIVPLLVTFNSSADWLLWVLAVSCSASVTLGSVIYVPGLQRPFFGLMLIALVFFSFVIGPEGFSVAVIDYILSQLLFFIIHLRIVWPRLIIAVTVRSTSDSHCVVFILLLGITFIVVEDAKRALDSPEYSNYSQGLVLLPASDIEDTVTEILKQQEAKSLLSLIIYSQSCRLVEQNWYSIWQRWRDILQQKLLSYFPYQAVCNSSKTYSI